MGVVAAQAAWLLFVVFSLTSPRAPGDESNDGSNAKGARGSGRSKWRRGRRRCLLATARHWGAGAEDGEERRCGAAGDHGGAAPLLERYGGVTCTTLMRESGHPRVVIRFDSPRTYTRSASWDEGRRLRVTKAAAAAAAEDGEERRCGAAGDHGGAAPLLERYGGVTCTTLMRESGHPRVVIRFDSPRTYTRSASWDEGRRLRVTKAAAAAAAEAAVAEDHEGSARSGLARRKMEKTAAAAATKSLRLEAGGP